MSAIDPVWSNLPQIITAIGGLGTAAFGLVDATKPFFGGVNRLGFPRIKNAVTALTPDGGTNSLPPPKVIDTLRANWYNGTDLNSQKAIAKSLIKLNLNETNAPVLADKAGVDRDLLKQVAASIASGTPLTTPQSDVFARFDLIVTALLDEAYQRSDEFYRNGTKVLAMIFAILLALAGAATMQNGVTHLQALVVGILATPLAPIAKDLSTALATAVNALQAVKK
jgi:hypothetical protein